MEEKGSLWNKNCIDCNSKNIPDLLTFLLSFAYGDSSSGRTPDSESGSPGSNPGSPAR